MAVRKVIVRVFFSFDGRFQVFKLGHTYGVVSSELPTGWFHLTIIYEGKGNGLKVYYDGVLKSSDSESHPGGYDARGSGRIVIGRKYAAYNGHNSEVMVDELALWNS